MQNSAQNLIPAIRKAKASSIERLRAELKILIPSPLRGGLGWVNVGMAVQIYISNYFTYFTANPYLHPCMGRSFNAE